MKVLNVAEKNDAAKNIANILSRGSMRRKDGMATYNKIYEFPFEHPALGNVQMVFTSVSGHLLNLDFPLSHRSWNSCDPLTLFDASITQTCSKDMEPVKNNILNLVKYSGLLIIWTDCDREGENIGFEVINVCKGVKPNLRVMRARFSEITGQAINNAISNLVPPDKRQSDAVEVRKELDLRIGAAFTRFQTMFLQKRLMDQLPNAKVISYGSCQFPTLGFVVERFKQRQEFESNPFWHLDIKHSKGGVTAEFKWDRIRLFDEGACTALYSKAMMNPMAKVTKVDSRPKSRWRPTPMDTIQMEKLASQKLRINAKATMKIAEKLYTSGLISYPRTETNIFPPDLNLQNYVELQQENPAWGAFATKLLADGLTPRQGKKTDKAHPPIHPTKYSGTLSGDEKKVYELIVRHFLACLSQDAKGSETTVDIDVNTEAFHATGLLIYARNYLDVYPYEKWAAKEIPDYKLGEQFMPDEFMMNEGRTTAPSLLSESDLIALMEKHGIGTDATHADHIETIQVREYVEMNSERRFAPRPLGYGLIEAYNVIRDEMSKPFLRAGLEKDLQSICDGTKQPDIVLREQIQRYKEIFSQVTERKTSLEAEVRRKFTEHGTSARNTNGTNDSS